MHPVEKSSVGRGGAYNNDLLWLDRPTLKFQVMSVEAACPMLLCRSANVSLCCCLGMSAVPNSS